MQAPAGRAADQERRVGELARRQHGVVSRGQLLKLGFTARRIDRRVALGYFRRVHRGVYAYGYGRLDRRAQWMAAVLAAGPAAVLSHRSAAALWGFARAGRAVDVSARHPSRKPGLCVHQAQLTACDCSERDGIPVTTLERTLFDLAGRVDERELLSAFEEADRLYLLDLRALRELCESRGSGRRGAAAIRRVVEAAQAPELCRSALEARFLELCRDAGLPLPMTNVAILGLEVDAVWPAQRVIAELDGVAFHRHRAAFERDRARDAALQAGGYRVVRLTHRRLAGRPGMVAAELCRLLERGRTVESGSASGAEERKDRLQHAAPAIEGRDRRRQSGQSTVEWVGLLLVVALLLSALVAAGVRMPGAALAQAVASRILCAAALADGCGDEPVLIAAYGDEVGRLARAHMPTLLFERGSKALPVDFRRCRATSCADGVERGLVRRSAAGEPVTAFVHAVDCRPQAAAGSEAAGADCSGERAGNLYLQYWVYYANSATLRGVPIAGPAGFHLDDWESVQIRIGSDGEAAERASSHNGYNAAHGAVNWSSDADIGPVRDLVEALGARPRNGWGPETRLLLVSGGSHAGNTEGIPNYDRVTPGTEVHLIPLEPLVQEGGLPHFAISPPWRKRVWGDPEASGTD